MDLRSTFKNRTTMMRLGMSVLLLASLARWFVHPGPWLTSNALDLILGLLYGVAIGCLLRSVVLGRSVRRGV